MYSPPTPSVSTSLTGSSIPSIPQLGPKLWRQCEVSVTKVRWSDEGNFVSKWIEKQKQKEIEENPSEFNE